MTETMVADREAQQGANELSKYYLKNTLKIKKVCCWDTDTASWTSDGIEEAEWQPTKRSIRVHTTRCNICLWENPTSELLCGVAPEV